MKRRNFSWLLYPVYGLNNTVQKQPLPDVLQKTLKVCNFIKKRFQHRCFPVYIAKFLRTAFFYRTPLVAVSDVKPYSLFLFWFLFAWSKELTHFWAVLSFIILWKLQKAFGTLFFLFFWFSMAWRFWKKLTLFARCIATKDNQFWYIR